MKKIVGIIAAATMAASMFAVDFSAGVRFDGDLFNYGSDKTISVLQEKHNNQFYHAPISFATSGDVAGGQLKLSEKDGDAVIADAWSIWFKPVDALKVTVGRWSTNLNQEHIGWCNTDSGIESDGYALSVAAGAFSADVFLASGNGNYYITKAADADKATIGQLYAKAQFSADFGTVNGFVNANKNFEDYRFGAGVNVAGLPVGLWVNAIGQYTAKNFQRVRAELDVSGAIDSVGYELFIAGGANLTDAPYTEPASWDPNTQVPAAEFKGVDTWHVGGTRDKGAFCGFLAKVSMPVAGVGAYVELKDSNVLAKDFAMNIKPGFTTSVGACAINTAVSVDIDTVSYKASKVAVSVPLEFKVNF